MEYPHHGDALVPRQQRFAKYTRSLMKGLGIPVENHWGLRPATHPGTTKTAAALDRAAIWTRAAGSTGVSDVHLPHAPAALRGDDGRPERDPRAGATADRSCRSRIRSPKPGTSEFNMFVWMPPRGEARRRRARCRLHDLQHACSAVTRASSVSGRTSPRSRNACRCSSSTTSRAASCGRARRRYAATYIIAPHRRPRTRGGS